MTLRLLAPAKINLTLEVLGKRADGYHEVASIMQTIDLADRVAIDDAPDLQILVSGPEAHGAPEDPAANLAYRAAAALRETAGLPGRGARIELEKRIPAGAGLGGGSSDAAAVLRGLVRLWRLDIDAETLHGIAAGLGSDVPFFLHGGTAFASGRGTEVEPIADAGPVDFVLFLSPSLRIEDKTRRMYGALRPEDFTDGYQTGLVRRVLEQGHFDGDALFNAFDRAVGEVVPNVGAAMWLCKQAGLHVIAAGAGPSYLTPTTLGLIHPSLPSALESQFGVTTSARRFLTASEALAIRET